MNQLIISVYGSHNAAVSMYYNGKYYVVEVERWANIKNSGLLYYNAIRTPQIVFDEITEWLLSHTNGEDVDIYLVGYADTIVPKFKYKKLVRYDHHTAHAATAFYQSPYDEMLVFTFDGGGDGAFFNVYNATRTHGIKLMETFKQDLGFPYMVLAEVLDDIKKEDLSIGNLVYAGKLMGLCAYGNVRQEWIQAFDEFYDKFNYSGESYIGGSEVMKEAMESLFNSIGIHDYKHKISRYKDQMAWDIAATSQQAFENQFFKHADKFLEAYPDMPIGLSGGCALNVLLNTKLAIRRQGKIYVPPNTNDCGMSVGGIMWYMKPEQQIDLTYSGLPIMDRHLVTKYVNELNLSVCDSVTIKELAGYISEGYIVGILQGNSEHGSRALGNRSIICAPSGNMKDVINHKVKKREWYRPFAPVVRFEDVNEYFDFEYESQHMTYAAPVRNEWRSKIPAVTHQDGTGRLQTVQKGQNQLLYDLICEFKTLTGYGVLLNTSFNVNGKPILTTLSDAFKLLKESSLDAVFFNNKLYFKPEEDKAFVSIRKSNGKNITPLSKDDKPTICLIHDGEFSEKIVKDIDKLKKHYTDIFFASTAETNTEVCYKLDWLKTFEFGAGKHYHTDRFLNFIDKKEIPRYLKLIWAREIIGNNKHRFINAAFIDYTQTLNIDKTIKDLKLLEAKWRANPNILHVNVGKDEFGIILGDCNMIERLVDISETTMISALYSNSKPLTDKELLQKTITSNAAKRYMESQ